MILSVIVIVIITGIKVYASHIFIISQQVIRLIVKKILLSVGTATLSYGSQTTG